MGYWKSTVVPKFKKLFEKNSKKTAAAEACKAFDDAKLDYSKEFEEKKAELEAKVIEIYEAASAEIKATVKERKEGLLKKVSTEVEKFLEELSKIEFPGSKPAHEACCKYGATYVEGPIFFVFEKVSTYIVVVEEKTEEVVPPAAEPEVVAAPIEESSSKEKEIVVEEEKKEEKKEEVVTPVEAEVEKTPEPVAPKAEEPAVTEPPKAC